jgi:hypothetical protein
MSTKRHFTLTLVAAAGCLLVLAPSLRADVVAFDNTTNNKNYEFDPGSDQVGDQIILGNQPANAVSLKVTDFIFQYWGINLGASATADVRFYKNDGPNGTPGSSPIWDSGDFQIASTSASTLEFNVANGAFSLNNPVEVPLDFTWTVQFSNLGAGGSAGVNIYTPPTVGNDYTDYWDNTPNGWVLKVSGGSIPINMDFAAKLSGNYAIIPEPATWLTLALGGLGLLFYRRRSRAI